MLLGLVVSPVVSAESVDPASGYAAIQRAFLQEDYPTVTNLAEMFLAQSPDSARAPRVWIWLSMSLDRLGRTEDALRALDRLKARLERDDPLWPEVLFWEGDISRRASQMLRAKLAWTRLLEQFPESKWASPQVRLGLGLVYLSQQAVRTALEHFRAASSRAPQDPLAMELQVLEGLCLLRLERFVGAIAAFHPLLQRLTDPDDAARVAFYLAEAFSGLGRHEEAIQVYQRSIEARPDSSWSELARFGIGWAQFQLGRCEESVETFTSFQQRLPAVHEPEALFARGSCLVQLGEDEQAFMLLSRLLAHAPSHPLAFESGLLVADIDRREGRARGAAARLERLLRQTQEAPSRMLLHLRLGAVRLDQGDAAVAMDHFVTALQTPDLEIQLEALNGLGDVQMYLGEYHKAQRRYEEVQQLLERVPPATTFDGGAYAMYQMGRIQLLLGENAEAAEIFHRLIAQVQPPLADDARLALALAYMNDHEEERARTQLEAIRRTRHGSAVVSRAAYYLAILALADGREEDVRRFCREAVDGAPRSDEGVEARILLAEMDAGRQSLGEAIARLRRAFDGHATLPRHRGRLAKKLGDFSRLRHAYAEAIHWYELAGELTPSLRGEIAYRLASCYEENGDIDVAISRYRAVFDPAWMVRGQLATAKLLERQGRWEAAEAVYESLAHEPIPEAKVAREHLALLRGDPVMGEAP